MIYADVVCIMDPLKQDQALGFFALAKNKTRASVF